MQYAGAIINRNQQYKSYSEVASTNKSAYSKRIDQINLLRTAVKQLWIDIRTEHFEQIEQFGKSEFIDIKFIEETIIDPLEEFNTSDWLKCHPHLLTIDPEYPKIHYNDRGHISFIQLRAVPSNITTLVIGCGNNPATNCYHVPNVDYNYKTLSQLYNQCIACYPTDNSNWYGKTIWNQTRRDWYYKIHKHDNCITCDVDVKMNPTFIGFAFITNRPLPIPDNQFTSIIEEGITLASLSGYDPEKKRLCKNIE